MHIFDQQDNAFKANTKSNLVKSTLYRFDYPAKDLNKKLNQIWQGTVKTLLKTFCKYDNDDKKDRLSLVVDNIDQCIAANEKPSTYMKIYKRAFVNDHIVYTSRLSNKSVKVSRFVRIHYDSNVDRGRTAS